MLASGMVPDDILEAFPSLERQDIDAALSYAARGVDHPIVSGAAVGGSPGLRDSR